MRVSIIVIALIVVFGCADIYWNNGAYSRMVVHSIGQGIAVLVNNW